MAKLLHEGAINLKDGQSIRDFLEVLRNAAVEKVVPSSRLRSQALMAASPTSTVSSWTPPRRVWWSWPSATGAKITSGVGDPEEVTPARAYVPIGTTPLRVDEAVTDPKAAERRNLPPEAFAAPFYEGEDGTYEEGGVFNRSKSQLPHHTAAVKKANDDATVDLPRLRNAMTKFQKTPWSSFGEAKGEVRAFARRHLTAHATRLLRSDRAGECVEEGIEDALMEMTEMEIREAMREMERPTSAWRAHAVDVFEQYSGSHHLAARLGAFFVRSGTDLTVHWGVARGASYNYRTFGSVGTGAGYFGIRSHTQTAFGMSDLDIRVYAYRQTTAAVLPL